MDDNLTITVPPRLDLFCRSTPERTTWLQQLPGTISELASRWQLTWLGAPFIDPEGSCAWVAPAIQASGAHAVLKIGVPHMEAQQEIDGLRFWAGDPTVLLLDADSALNAMLLERCEPGSTLQPVSAAEQDRIIAGLLRRLWRPPSVPHHFRHLSAMTSFWCEETMRDRDRWPDPALVDEGIHAFEFLSKPAHDDVLLATDLHAGNVLRARREPWLVIDPKPFVGDRAYDATQHLFNRGVQFALQPDRMIQKFAELAEVDARRLRLWLFARAAAEPRELWDDERLSFARSLRV